MDNSHKSAKCTSKIRLRKNRETIYRKTGNMTAKFPPFNIQKQQNSMKHLTHHYPFTANIQNASHGNRFP